MEDLAPAERDRLLARFGRRFVAGQVLFREGEPAAEAFLLQEGRVRLIKRVRGVERSLMVLRPGDLFGESALLAGADRSSTAVALADGAAVVLDQETLRTLIEGHPTVASRVVQQLARRLRDAEDQIEITLLRDAPSKLAAALLQLARALDPPAPGAPWRIDVTPLELSTRVGLEVEAVRRAMNRLRTSGYVRVTEERLEIDDLEPLRKLLALLETGDRLRGEPTDGDPPDPR